MRCRFGEQHHWISSRDRVMCGTCGLVEGTKQKVDLTQEGVLVRLGRGEAVDTNGDPIVFTDDIEEAWNAAHQDLLILSETDRVKARELLAGIAGGDFNAADGLIGSLRRNGFEIVSATAMVATPEAAAAIAKRGNTTYRCQVQQAGSGTCTWPTCGCGDA